MKQVINQLDSLRQRSRAVLVLQSVAGVCAWTVGVGLGLILVDYVLRLPSALRLALLAGATGLLCWAFMRYVRSSVLFRPSLTQVALRVERDEPSLRGRLASSVEFARSGLDQVNALAGRSVRDAQARLQGHSLRRILRTGPAWRAAGALAAIAAAAGFLALNQPLSAATGLRRLLLPYSSAMWPPRTAVRSLMTEVLVTPGVHPRGQNLALRAMNLTPQGEDERVDARYRFQTDGEFGPWETIVLTHQGRGVHERLVDTNPGGGGQTIEFSFHTADASTAIETVELVPPPAVVRATLAVSPPPYVSGDGASSGDGAWQAELGPGTDDRAAMARPALAGSTAVLTLELNKPLPVPEEGADRDAWRAQAFDWGDAEQPRFEVDEREPARWELSWRLEQTRVLAVNLQDEHSLKNEEPIGYRVHVVADGAPDVTVTQPETDEVVLATAVVGVVCEARDDVAVSRVAIEAAVQKRAESGEQGSGNLSAQPDWMKSQSVDAAVASIEGEIDLAPLKLVEGDVVHVTGLADDRYELDGERHPTSRSPARRLRVIGELDFASQLRQQLAGVRQNAIRIEALQGELQEDVIDDGVQPGIDRAQAQIAERIASQGEAIDAIARQMRANRLDDEQLRELLTQSRDLLEFAGRAANAATAAIESRGRGDSTSAGEDASPQTPNRADAERSPRERSNATAEKTTPAADDERRERSVRDSDSQAEQAEASDSEIEQAYDDEFGDLVEREAAHAEARPEHQPIVQAQQEVREELADLIELLDRDEDTWVVKRQLETLAQEQQKLQTDTAELGRRTLGKSRSDLTEQEQTELDRIAERQRDIQEQSRKLTEDLRDRAEAMEDIDERGASGMRRAADTAEQRGLDRDMTAAAERVEQNQTRNAEQAQQSAQQTMQRMLEDIEESKRARAEELLRRLASLVESIERLIFLQESELSALAASAEIAEFAGRDRAMIRLHQNTIAVSGEARAAGQESRRVARSLDRAADAQSAAVSALRATPVSVEKADEAENRSLELLKEAKQLAEELQQQTQDEETRRQREALIEAYRGFAERQIALRDQAQPLVAAEELSRRELVEVRRLGSQQEALRLEIAEVRDTTNEVRESPIFSHTHRLIDEWALAAAQTLSEGIADVTVLDHQQLVADSLGRLIDAMEEAMAPPPQFAGESEQGAGEGQGDGASQQALLPPVAHLKLLRGLQEQIYEQTRATDARQDLSAAQSRTRLRELGRMQRDLMQLGEQMVEELRQNSGPPTAGDGDPGDAGSGEDGAGESEPQESPR